jgi:putative PIN family toxin of toxin-antitoxin system
VNVVYDTMVFLQNAAVPGRTHATFRAVKDGTVTLCLSVDLITEVRDVLNREGIRRKFPALTATAIEGFVADVLVRARLFEPVLSAFSWTRHPDDDHLFNLVIAAKADRLVTWEARLLSFFDENPEDAPRLRQLAPQLRIVTPVQLTEELRALTPPGANPPK